MAADFTHFNEEGRARMVDVGSKAETERAAVAAGRVLVNEETFRLIECGGMKKGDVLGTAQIAGIMAAQKTSDIVPRCHPLMLTKVAVDFFTDEEHLEIEAVCTVGLTGKTGVEMEALTGVSTALLTIYDMCKAMDRGMMIREVCLVEKSGGKSGHYKREV